MSLKDELVKSGMWAANAQALSDALDTSSERAANLTDETGTGAAMFATAPVFRFKVATVAAAGTNAATGGALTEATCHLVTGADDNKGVTLPTAAAGKWVIIKVGDGADLKIWPATGDAINAIAADSAMTVVDDVSLLLWCLDATTWYTLPLLPS
jgi:hypothetical protein